MQHTSNRKLWARIWIGVTFVILVAAQCVFFRFSRDNLNFYAGASMALTVGSALWIVVLTGAMWMRHAWARYGLATVVCIGIIGFAAILLKLHSESLIQLDSEIRTVIFGLLLNAIALIPLGTSHTLRDFLGPRSGPR